MCSPSQGESSAWGKMFIPLIWFNTERREVLTVLPQMRLFSVVGWSIQRHTCIEYIKSYKQTFLQSETTFSLLIVSIFFFWAWSAPAPENSREEVKKRKEHTAQFIHRVCSSLIASEAAPVFVYLKKKEFWLSTPSLRETFVCSVIDSTV